MAQGVGVVVVLPVLVTCKGYIDLISITHKVQKNNRCFEQSKKLVRDTLILLLLMVCFVGVYFHLSTANCIALHCLFANWMKFMRLKEA